MPGRGPVLEGQDRAPQSIRVPAEVDGGRLAQPGDDVAFAHAESDAAVEQGGGIRRGRWALTRICGSARRRCDVVRTGAVRVDHIICGDRAVLPRFAEGGVAIAAVAIERIERFREPFRRIVGAAADRKRYCQRRERGGAIRSSQHPSLPLPWLSADIQACAGLWCDRGADPERHSFPGPLHALK